MALFPRRLLLPLRTTLALLSCTALAPPAPAQALLDTLFTWEAYAQDGRCRVRLYPTPPSDARRSHTIVVQELAENPGPSTLRDARHLIESIGRAFALDPAESYWIFHWGAFSFPQARASTKEVFLRATLRRERNGRLGPPLWRVIFREEVEHYTDRRFDAPGGQAHTGNRPP